jgi:hypothetical protein
VGSISFFYFLGLARINPDPHRDGIQFAAAAGVADNLNIHSQVYEQYGPVGAWIQGETLKVFGSILLNLRIENAFVLTLAALLTLNILFTLGIPDNAAVLVSLGWALSCPASSVYSGVFGFWPWSSTFVLIFLLANARVFLRVRLLKRAITSWEIYFASASCATIIFTRLQVGIVVSIINLVLIFTGQTYQSAQKRRQSVGKFLTSLSVFTGGFLSILVFQGSLASFIDQVIVGPMHQYFHPIDWIFIRNYYFLGSIPTILGLFLAAIVWRNFPSSFKTVVLAFIAGVIGLLMYIGNWSYREHPSQFDSIHAILYVQSMGFIFASVVVYLALSFFLVLGGILSRKSPFANGLKPIEKMDRGVLGTLLALLIPFAVQLYPKADVYHLWWVAPLFMVLIPYCLGSLISRKGVEVVVAVLLVPALLASTISYVDLLKVSRSELSQGALAGMQVEKQYVPSYFAVNEVLQTVKPNSARFYCADGLLSTWTGSYLSIDAAYVSWAWVKKIPPTIKYPDRIFFCGSKEAADSFAVKHNLKMVGSGIPLHLSYWSYGSLYEFSP